MADKKEATKVATTEAADVSTTEKFQAHIKAIVEQILGGRVSKEKAWKLFKALNRGTYEFVVKETDGKLSLSGVGAYVVMRSEAKGKKADEGYPFVPRVKYYASSKLSAHIEEITGAHNHGLNIPLVGLFAEGETTTDPVAETKTAAKAAPLASDEI